MVDSVNLRTIYNQNPNGSQKGKSTTDYTTVNQFYWSGEEQGLSTK